MVGPLHPKRRDQSTTQIGSAPSAPESLPSADEGTSDFAFIALWMAASLAGLVTAALARQAPLLRSLMRRLRLRRPAGANPSCDHKLAKKRPRRPSPQEALPMLAEAIVGSSKSAVAKVFGPPHGAAVSSKVVGLGSATFWLAETWYYSMPRSRPLAMAIRFADDSARTVEFIPPPRDDANEPRA